MYRFSGIVKAGMVLAITLCYGFVSNAQVRDTLGEIRVKGRRNKPVSNDDRLNTFSPGQKVTTIDSFTLQQYQFQNMANLLAQQTPVFIKSYGFNALSTLNFRGSSAAQSQVYWNGIPIQNAALGMSDISLLPVSLMDKVNIVYGSSSALWGSGNVGGALLIENNKPVFDSNGRAQHSVSAVAGSYSQYQLGLRSSLSTRKWYVAANAFGQTARNDFSYFDPEDKSRKQTLNSDLQSGVVMLNGGYKIDDRNTISLTGWYQQYYREIPRALFEPVSIKSRRDESLRLLLDWNRTGIKLTTHAKLAYIRDNMVYEDTTIQLKSVNNTSQVYGEAGVKYRFNAHHQLLAFTPVHISVLERGQYSDAKTQNRAALAMAYAFTHLDDRLNFSASLRGEMINDISVLLPGANGSFAIAPWLMIRGNAQKTYRAPTLSELYYQPGGNEELKPEKGWSFDGGYAVKTRGSNALVLTHDLSVFTRLIDDWIIWFGGAVWTPHNIASVHSRGIETENKLQWRIQAWKLHLGVNTAYVLSTTEESDLPGDGSIGKQIPYAPRYNGQANIGFTWKSLYLNYNHTYTGYRFYTTDESGYILPYNTGNLQLFYTMYIRSKPLQLTGQVNNVWNQRYEVVNARPMPGTNWLLGVRATLAD
ncbi:TonB-dependent receptor [Polluticoccus soli]|uniref:TonB-dependent receptor n=1 Tax=Polluticoccus soli TaxID=3034150 RepID=UPI0023E2DE45|nr:TonB-dependent receptor [Flavipsychrobacter sp. JY13-12]